MVNSAGKKAAAAEAKAAAERALALQTVENAHTTVYEQLLMIERNEFLEACVQHLMVMCDPAKGFMVHKATFDLLLQENQVERRHARDQIHSLQQELHRVTSANDVLDSAFKELRQAHLEDAAFIRQELNTVRADVDHTLKGYLDAAEKAMRREIDDTAECTRCFNESLVRARDHYLDMVRKQTTKAHSITILLQEHKSFHTNIPNRIRQCLAKETQESLLLILDTMSFHESTLHYLLMKFPPSVDVPPEVCTV